MTGGFKTFSSAEIFILTFQDLHKKFRCRILDWDSLFNTPILSSIVRTQTGHCNTDFHPFGVRILKRVMNVLLFQQFQKNQTKIV